MLRHFFFQLLGIMAFGSHVAFASGSVTLYTPYTKISVPPGESIDYTIDIINNSSELQDVEVTLSGIPRGWTYILKSGGWNIGQVSVMPGEKKSLSLKVEVPFKVNKGSYHFKVEAKGFYSLPVTVIVSEQGTFKTELTTKQSNMEGPATSSFNYEAELRNRTAADQLYSLTADVPRGWVVTFRADGRQVTSVNVEANITKQISVTIDPPDEIKAGIYKIPVRTLTNTTSAGIELEVVITGSYKLDMSTPTGLVSTDVTVGGTKRVELVLINSGSSELKDISLDSSVPINWEVTFDPKKVDRLESGERVRVMATIKAAKRAIAGDYITRVEAKTPEASSKLEFRISVKTSMLTGWIGVVIILAALGSVYYLFRKYGRR